MALPIAASTLFGSMGQAASLYKVWPNSAGAVSVLRSAIRSTRATTWPKTTTSRPTTCVPMFPGRGGPAPTTSATRGTSGRSFLPGRDRQSLLLARDPQLRGHRGHRHPDHRGHAPRGRLLRAGPRRPLHHLGLAGSAPARSSGVIVAVTEPSVAERRAEIYLPRPPDDQEKYKYFGKPRRWVFAWLLVASAGVLYGYIHVAERAWLVAPLMWLLLMVMVPPVVVNFWLRIGPPQADPGRAPGRRGQLPGAGRDGGRVPAQLR